MTDLPPVVIEWDGGGLVAEYGGRIAVLRKAGRRVVIDGPCFSACTMYSAVACATPNAVLYFHAARSPSGRISKVSTSAMAAFYPEKLRQWLRLAGGLSRRWITIRPPQLWDFVPRCEGAH